MGSPRISADLVFSPACVATGAIPHFEQNEIPEPALIESPCSRKSGDASSDDHDWDSDGLSRTRERRPIAQPVAQQVAVIDEAASDGSIRFACKSDEGGAKELAAGRAQCVISRQSRS